MRTSFPLPKLYSVSVKQNKMQTDRVASRCFQNLMEMIEPLLGLVQPIIPGILAEIIPRAQHMDRDEIVPASHRDLFKNRVRIKITFARRPTTNHNRAIVIVLRLRDRTGSRLRICTQRDQKQQENGANTE